MKDADTNLPVKMNFLKLEHKRAETAKCPFGLRARGKEGAERKKAPWTLISVRGRYNFMPI